MALTYQNQVFLKGVVGDDIIFKRARTGKDYCSFSLIVNHDNKYLSEDETNSVEYIRIMIFNNKRKKLVDKLKEMGLRRGNYVSIIGRLQTARTEYRGISLIQLTVQVNDLSIIQTKPQNDKENERVQTGD